MKYAKLNDNFIKKFNVIEMSKNAFDYGNNYLSLEQIAKKF